MINIGFVSIDSNSSAEQTLTRKLLRKSWVLLGTLMGSNRLLTQFIGNCLTLSSLFYLKQELINPEFLEYALNSSVKAFGRRTIKQLAIKYERENILFDQSAVDISGSDSAAAASIESKQSKSKSKPIPLPELLSASDSEITVEENEPLPVKTIKKLKSTPMKPLLMFLNRSNYLRFLK